ncbi:MAG: hypothetical protein AB1714_29365 [Acidobacteriota bacterium]
MSTTCFLMADDNDYRVEMVREGEEAEGIKVLHHNGTSRFYPRTGH